LLKAVVILIVSGHSPELPEPIEERCNGSSDIGVGSMVEVNVGEVPRYGVVRWAGYLHQDPQHRLVAGIEMVCSRFEANLAPMIINVPNFSRRTTWWGRATALSTDADTSNALQREDSLSACHSAGWTGASKTKLPLSNGTQHHLALENGDF
jgi:hypothetical protein